MKNNYQICTKTVMDTQSSITFDDGISNHYWDFEKNTKKWYPNQTGKDLLDKKIQNLIKAGKAKSLIALLVSVEV